MPLFQSLIMLTLAVMAGAVIPLQGGINALLGKNLGHPLWATLASLLVSVVALGLVLLLLRPALPNLALATKAPLWVWSGGLYGVCFISLALILIPKLGASGFVAAAIAGQLIASLLLDHFGALGLALRPLSGPRLLGALLLVAGVAVIQWSAGEQAEALKAG
jgi:transporter family-2 protein